MGNLLCGGGSSTTTTASRVPPSDTSEATPPATSNKNSSYSNVATTSNSNSAGSIAQNSNPSNEQKACFGAGCYWGTEKYFRYDFKKYYSAGKVLRGQVGFMGPSDAPESPTYEDVCSGRTGHVEVYDLDFSGGLPAYEELCKFFFQMHDPTTKNRQGNDAGTQYASVIYCYSQDQIDIANKVIKELQGFLDKDVVTKYAEKRVNTNVLMATKFYEAKSEHQDYLAKNPKGYCNHRIRFQPWPITKAAEAPIDDHV